MKKTVFVVDDSETNLSAAEEALEDNYNVITVSSGKRAIAILEKIKPQLILLDINMPGMDGFEVLETLKSQEEFQEIPVIFLTSTADPVVKAKGMDMGASDFVIKPFAVPALLSRIEEYI